ncbi:MAG: T9SS type A sorting domain-containing protein [Saprospiraceae bacterium]|nr:T9SS type A sorting domain-containing protein [Saprospiraceae bacterium]
MKKNLTLISLLAMCMLGNLNAQTTTQAQVGHARLLGITKPLRELTPVLEHYNKTSRRAKGKMNKSSVPNFTQNVPMPQPFLETALPHGADPLVQQGENRSNASVQVIPQLVFDGINQNESEILPPDPSGYIGSNHYIQSTNYFDGTIFEVFDKDGVSVYGPASTAPFWEDFNITGFGDPVVVYDHEYDRWLITEFGPFGSTVFLVAISATSDPLGTWFAYEFQAPSFPDYPKYSVWNNSYFITSNETSDEIPVYALNREQMIAGAATADMVRLPALPKFQAVDAFQVATPITWDGSIPPPADEPGYVVRIYDDAWEGGADGLELWQIHIDWDTPSNSSATGPIFLTTAPFDSKVCSGGIFDCIAQPDGTTLSALEQVVMHRAQYRNFGTHESIVLNHVVDVDGNNLTGIRWYELRRFGSGDWEVHQQGTYTQPDGNHRFMASIAMDLNGNMLMGFSVTGPDQLLSLRYTGRLANDPLGEMTVEEYEFGTGLSMNPFNRWGDYASMTVDPVDQRSFWFTGEYMLDNGVWGTKIMKAFIQRDSNDIAPSALITPQNSGYLTNAEPVKVALRNFGYKPAADFSVSLVFNGNLVATEMIADTLMPDSTRFYTFGPSVDLSAIGSYPFTIYTSYSLDTTFINDTLRAVVKQLPRNDAAILGITGLGSPICGTELNTTITLQNNGVDTLYSVTINYQTNGGTIYTIDWVGALPPGQTEEVPFITTEVVAGANNITAYVTQPNGVADENPLNDEISRPFSIVTDGQGITLELLTDEYPSETTWELFNQNGEVIFSGGPYTQQITLNTIPMCIEAGCYTFSIYDSYGDGMYWPASGIMGNYEIFNSDGQVIANIAQAGFGFQEDNDFCTDGTCGIEILANISFESASNSNDGSVIFDVQNGVSPFEFSIDNGVSYQPSPLFTNLSSGIYYVYITDASGCLMKDSIVIGTCTLQSSILVTAAATSNSNDGLIEVTTVNGYPPYQYRLVPGNFQNSPNFTMLDEGNYTVEVVDSLGCSNVFDITVTATTGTQSVTFGTSVKIYPNPTEGTFSVEVKTAGNLDVLPLKIYDASGKVVLHNRLVSYNGVLMAQISLKAYPSGVYFLQLYNDASGFNQLMQVVKK